MAASKNPMYWSNLEVRTRIDKKYNDNDHYSWTISKL